MHLKITTPKRVIAPFQQQFFAISDETMINVAVDPDI